MNCDAGVHCAQVTAMLGAAATLQGSASGPNAIVFNVAQDAIPSTGTTLKLLYNGKDAKSYTLVPAATGGGPPPQTSNTTSTLTDLLSCDPSHAGVPGYTPYDADRKEAWFVVTALGTLIDAPNAAAGEVIDESDTVKITLLVNPAIIPYLRVKRSSAARTLGGFAVVGSGTELSRQSLVACTAYTVMLRDFAPGTGSVQISTQIGDKETNIGSFDFSVATLYHGMLSFGALVSDRLNDSFVLAPKNGGNVIVSGTEGASQTFYAVYYTPFIWGARTTEKPPRHWYQHINPSFGVVTTQLDQHALVGISGEWNGFLFTVGKHYARGTVLSSASGLKVGDAFTGTADQIPTAKRWGSSTFYSVSFDLRAAAALIKAAVSATK